MRAAAGNEVSALPTKPESVAQTIEAIRITPVRPDLVSAPYGPSHDGGPDARSGPTSNDASVGDIRIGS